ncbi:hypothetical protein PG996_012203 [Apiospora saccharicola]|uniref:Uncharacterized protein n=1 Tax=Apiospora saccharicola TaxID=335842 RepID=A0ABR1U1W5_9PEZI
MVRCLGVSPSLVQGPEGIPARFPWLEKFTLPSLVVGHMIGVLCRWMPEFKSVRERLRDALLIDEDTHAATVCRAPDRRAPGEAVAKKKRPAEAYTTATAATRNAVPTPAPEAAAAPEPEPEGS